MNNGKILSGTASISRLRSIKSPKQDLLHAVTFTDSSTTLDFLDLKSLAGANNVEYQSQLVDKQQRENSLGKSASRQYPDRHQLVIHVFMSMMGLLHSINLLK